MTGQDCVPIGHRVYATAIDQTGLLVGRRHLDAMKVGVEGTVTGYVPGHGGDAWWVQHDDGSVAAYWYPELEFARTGENDCLPVELL